MRILNCVPTQDAEGTLAERAMSDPKLVVGVGPSLVPEQIIFQGNVLSTNSQGAAMYVSVACQRLRIIKIAVADNEFECIFTLHLRWVDNYADGRSAEDTERAQDWIGDWKPEWDPLIEFTNIARPASLLRSNYKIDDEGFVRAFFTIPRTVPGGLPAALLPMGPPLPAHQAAEPPPGKRCPAHTLSELFQYCRIIINPQLGYVWRHGCTVCHTSA